MEQDTTKQTPDEQDKVYREPPGKEQFHVGYQSVAQVWDIDCDRESGNKTITSIFKYKLIEPGQQFIFKSNYTLINSFFKAGHNVYLEPPVLNFY